MDQIYSHPPEDGRDGVLLREHLVDVADRVQHVVPEAATTPADEPLKAVVEVLALVHDLGKATTFFQQYLRTGDEGLSDRQLRHHAPIGSFLAYYALDVQGYDTETCLAGFVAVGKHHGRLPDVGSYAFDRTDQSGGIEGTPSSKSQRVAIAKQIKDIGKNEPELADDVLFRATDGTASWAAFRSDFLDVVEDIAAVVETPGRMPGPSDEALSKECYALILECWSTLVHVDKTSAAGASNEAKTYNPERPTAESLEQYVKEIERGVTADPDGERTERLNHYRSRARSAVLEEATRLAADGGGIATLTLPTGMGKTLSGLSAALELRDQLDGDRVIYALPFTSVIDQVVDEVTDIYDTDTTGRLVTAHHHLAETVIRDSHVGDAEKADRTDAIGGMLAESWRAGLTVTTFVQLFESLAGPANRQSLKLPALRDSVVVLDEPQSLPLNWWKLVPRLVDLLVEQYGASVIAMTATQPQLFENETELVDDPDSYFKAVERVSYELDTSTERYVSDRTGPLEYDNAASALLETLEEGNSALAICNTIDSTRELTTCLAGAAGGLVDVADVFEAELTSVGDVDGVDPSEVVQRVTSAGNRALLHLSTRLRPADRLTLIETAKELTDLGYPLAVVSTQLVEAGVDISFDSVYRDLAPIDSVVQAAGRCNRSFERDQGSVRIWWLASPDGRDKTPAEAVYNQKTPLLPVTADALESVRAENGCLTETAVARKAVTEYYDRLHNEKNVGNDEYVGFVDDAKAEKLGDLSLIDERLAADVLVCRTEGDRVLADDIRDAFASREFERLKRLRQEAKPLTVSIPYDDPEGETAAALGTLPQILPDESFYQLNVDQHAPYFDSSTGFVVEDSTVEARIL